MSVIETASLRPGDDDEALIAFLVGGDWPFHGSRRPSEEKARRWLEEGKFHGPESRSAWLLLDGERLGLIALQELLDPTPIFDLRIAPAARRRGLGRRALAWATEEAFLREGRPRLEAHTRSDNAPMRALLRATPGWVQESFHRQAWPDAEGRLHDAVSYALLRSDWERGTRTAVVPLEG